MSGHQHPLVAQLCFQWPPVLADVDKASGCLWLLLAEVVSDSLALQVLVEMSLNNHSFVRPYTQFHFSNVRGGRRKEINSLSEPSVRFYCTCVRSLSAEVLLCLNWTSWNQLWLGSNYPQNQSILQVLSGTQLQVCPIYNSRGEERDTKGDLQVTK